MSSESTESTGRAGLPAPPRLVLVVDDDASYRQLIRWALEDEGWAVETAADGQEARASANQRLPSLAIVDVALMNGNGIVLADDLRRMYGGPLPIITITADGHAEEKARQMRASSCLHKPFDLEALVAEVRRLLSVGAP